MMRALLTLAALAVLPFAGRADVPHAGNYVQRNLIGLWDAIDNVGIGQHDVSATTWKDLSGNGYDFTDVGTAGGTFDATTLTLPNQKSITTNAKLTEASTHTFEARARVGDGFVDAGGSTAQSSLCSIGGYGGMGFKTCAQPDEWVVAAIWNSSSRKSESFDSGNDKSKVRSMALIKTMSTYSLYQQYKAFDLLIDGGLYLNSSSKLFYTQPSESTPNDNLTLGAIHGDHKGTLIISTARVYKEKLTDQERAYNLMLDQWRFDNIVPADWHLDAQRNVKRRIRFVAADPTMPFRVNGGAPVTEYEYLTDPTEGATANVSAYGWAGATVTLTPSAVEPDVTISGGAVSAPAFVPVAAVMTVKISGGTSQWRTLTLSRSPSELKVAVSNETLGCEVEVDSDTAKVVTGESLLFTVTAPTMSKPTFETPTSTSGTIVVVKVEPNYAIYRMQVVNDSNLGFAALDDWPGPLIAFRYRAVPGASPSGWFSSWSSGAFTDAAQSVGPGSYGTVGLVTDAAHPQSSRPAATAEPRSVLLYADISAVPSENGVICGFGGNGTARQGLVRSGDGVRLVAVSAAGESSFSSTATPAKLFNGYRTFILSYDGAKLALAVDGSRVATLSGVSSLGGGIGLGTFPGSPPQGLKLGTGLRVAEVVGFDAATTEEQELGLAGEKGFQPSDKFTDDISVSTPGATLDCGSMTSEKTVAVTDGRFAMPGGTAVFGALALTDAEMELTGGAKLTLKSFAAPVGTVRRVLGNSTFGYAAAVTDDQPIELTDSEVGTTLRADKFVNTYSGKVAGPGRLVLESVNGGRVVLTDVAAEVPKTIKSGTAELPTGSEGAATVKSGATLRLRLSALHERIGYTANDLVLDGGTLKFVTQAGVEKSAYGKSYVPSSTDANLWTGEANDGKWATAGNWKQGHAPRADETAVFAADCAVAIESAAVAKGLLTAGTVSLSESESGSLTLGAGGIEVTTGSECGWQTAKRQRVQGLRGPGTFVKRGAGVLEIVNDANGKALSALTVRIEGGEVQLAAAEPLMEDVTVRFAGGSLTCGDHAVKAHGQLVFENDGTASFLSALPGAALCADGNLEIVKRGDGALWVRGRLGTSETATATGAAGKLRIESGTLELVAPEAEFGRSFLGGALTGAGTLAVDAGAAVCLLTAKTADFEGTIAGEGTVAQDGLQVFDGYGDPERWKGTVELKGEFTEPDFDLSALGNRNSALMFDGVSGVFGVNCTNRIGSFVIGDGGLTLNGNFEQSAIYLVGALKGTGKITINTTSGSETVAGRSVWFVGETADFTGDIAFGTGAWRAVFADSLADAVPAIALRQIVLAGSKKLRIAAGSTWEPYANNGFYIGEKAVLTVEGTAKGRAHGAGTVEMKDGGKFSGVAADDWTGLVRFKDYNFATVADLSDFGLAGSVVEMDGVTGKFGTGNCPYELRVTGKGVTVSGGSNSTTSFAKLTGNAPLTVNIQSGDSHPIKITDASGYEGELTVAANSMGGVTIGTATPTAGVLTIGGGEVVQPVRAVWKADKITVIGDATLTADGALVADSLLTIKAGAKLRTRLSGERMSFKKAVVEGEVVVENPRIEPGDILLQADELDLTSASCVLNGQEVTLKKVGKMVVLIDPAKPDTKLELNVAYGADFTSAIVSGVAKINSGDDLSGKNAKVYVTLCDANGNQIGEGEADVSIEKPEFSLTFDGIQPGDGYSYSARLIYKGEEKPAATDAVRGFAATDQKSLKWATDGWVRENAASYSVGGISGIWSNTGYASAAGGKIVFNTYDIGSSSFATVNFLPTNATSSASGSEYRIKAAFQAPATSIPSQRGLFGVSLWGESLVTDEPQFIVYGDGDWQKVDRSVFAPETGTEYELVIRLNGGAQRVSYSVAMPSGEILLGDYKSGSSATKVDMLTFAGDGEVASVDGDIKDASVFRATVTFDGDGEPGANFTNFWANGVVRVDQLWDTVYADAQRDVLLRLKDATNGVVRTVVTNWVGEAEIPIGGLFDGLEAGGTYTIEVSVLVGGGAARVSGETQVSLPMNLSRRVASGWIDEDAWTFNGRRTGTGEWDYDASRASVVSSMEFGEAISLGGSVDDMITFTSTNAQDEILFSSLREITVDFRTDSPGYRVKAPRHPNLDDNDLASITIALDDRTVTGQMCFFAVFNGKEWEMTRYQAELGKAYKIVIQLNYRQGLVTYFDDTDGTRAKIATVTCEKMPEPNDMYRSQVKFAGCGMVGAVRGDCYDSHVAKAGRNLYYTIEGALEKIEDTDLVLVPLWKSIYTVSGQDGSFAVSDPNGLLELVWPLGYVVDSYTVDGVTYYVFRLSDNWIDFASENGVETSGDRFVILDESGLAWVARQAQNDYFPGAVVLSNDLDLAAHDWTPIACFAGSIDGRGHTVKGLSGGAFSGGCTNELGLTAFGLVGTARDATLRNIRFEEVAISNAADAVAALVGCSVGSLTVSNVTVASGRIRNDGEKVAGVVGLAENYPLLVLARNTNNAEIVSASAFNVRKSVDYGREAPSAYAAGIANAGGFVTREDGQGTVRVTDNANNGAVVTAVYALDPEGGNFAHILGGTKRNARFDSVTASGNTGTGDVSRVNFVSSNPLIGDYPLVNLASAVARQDLPNIHYAQFIEANDASEMLIDPVSRTARMTWGRFPNGFQNYAGRLYDQLSRQGAGATVTLTDSIAIHAPIVIDRNATVDLKGHTVEQLFDDYVFRVIDGAKATVKNGTVISSNGMVYVEIDEAKCSTQNVNCVPWSVPYWDYEQTVPIVDQDGIPYPNSLVGMAKLLKSGETVVFPEGGAVGLDEATGAVTLNGQTAVQLASIYQVQKSVDANGRTVYGIELKQTEELEPTVVALDLSESEGESEFSVVVTGTRVGLEYALQQVGDLGEEWDKPTDVWLRVAKDGDELTFTAKREGDRGFFRLTTREAPPEEVFE